MCNCAGCKPKTAVARANAAIRMLMKQRYLWRPFEHAFECSDQDDVVRHVTKRAKAEPELAERIRDRGYGYWLDPTQYAWLWHKEPHPFA